MPEVTFVALHALPAIDPSVPGIFGGTETRAWTFARALARDPEWKVNFAVRPRPPQSAYHGVHIERIRNPLYEVRLHVSQCLERTPRFPYVKLIRWSWHLLWEAPLLVITRPFRRRIDDDCGPLPDFVDLPGDVLITFGVHVDSVRTVAAGKQTGRPVILVLGADSDVDERYATETDDRDPYGNRADVCRRALLDADAIIAQTPQQATLLQQRFGRHATVISNPIDADLWQQQSAAPLPNRISTLQDSGYVLWIGRADRFHKRAIEGLEVAIRLPEIPFVMVLNPREADVLEEVHRRRPANLHLIPQVRFDEVASLFRNARVFMNTSAPAHEGFPNTFLQAAISGVPICSLEYGDDFLNRYGAGVSCSGKLDALVSQVQSLWNAQPTAASSVRSSVLRDYGLSGRLAELQAVVQGLMLDR
ncbi:MAG: glycosyltransferase family 4 protein [Planctomycetaceae bacterium]|nr:glycosyltransferase family 4 protein [Planctomycetaceae bacterium]